MSEAATAAPPAIPPGRALRVVGDVHGDSRAFAHACATDRFVVQLGDLVDYGPDTAGVLRLMFALIGEGRGLFLRGNHDHKLGRLLSGERRAHPAAPQANTLRQLDPDLREVTRAQVLAAPFWLRSGSRVFVHGAFHPAMLLQPSPLGPVTPDGPIARALFGEVVGRPGQDGFPERSLRWVDTIPPEITVYCGHDQRSRDGRPLTLEGRAGGRAVFLDTGAGKGGHLSWIDLSAADAGQAEAPGPRMVATSFAVR